MIHLRGESVKKLWEVLKEAVESLKAEFFRAANAPRARSLRPGEYPVLDSRALEAGRVEIRATLSRVRVLTCCRT